MNVDQDGQDITIRITDSGVGIPRDHWEKIFERGATSKGTDRGFGLYHVRRTLDMFDGSISVEDSAPSQGTTMLVKLRVAEESPDPGQA